MPTLTATSDVAAVGFYVALDYSYVLITEITTIAKCSLYNILAQYSSPYNFVPLSHTNLALRCFFLRVYIDKLETGHHQKAWCTGIIVPLFRKGKIDDTCDYTGILCKRLVLLLSRAGNSAIFNDPFT